MNVIRDGRTTSNFENNWIRPKGKPFTLPHRTRSVICLTSALLSTLLTPNNDRSHEPHESGGDSHGMLVVLQWHTVLEFDVPCKLKSFDLLLISLTNDGKHSFVIHQRRPL